LFKLTKVQRGVVYVWKIRRNVDISSEATMSKPEQPGKAHKKLEHLGKKEHKISHSLENLQYDTRLKHFGNIVLLQNVD